MKNIVVFATALANILMLASCAENAPDPQNEFGGGLIGACNYLRMTEDGMHNFSPDKLNCVPDDEIWLSHEEQNVRMRIVGIIHPALDIPKYYRDFGFWVEEWEEENGRFDDGWAYVSGQMNQPDDFYYVDTQVENDIRWINIHLDKNETGKRRQIRIHIDAGEYDQYEVCGTLLVYQEPVPESKVIMNAKYKDVIYTSEAEVDENGEYTYSNPEYAALIESLDNNPEIEIVILQEGIVNYYDQEDIAAGKIQADMKAINDGPYQVSHTRGDPFYDIYLTSGGWFGIYDHDNFGGTRHTKFLDNLHFTWNLPNLGDYKLDDKITSAALLYADESYENVAVLTLWEDPDYNFGDSYRKCHRISVIASKYNSRVKVPNFKAINKLGTNQSWNDCISSSSFHFGYFDTPLADY